MAARKFSVEDNGTGIDPQFHATIFTVFKRLHGKNIPGIGIGLAICQRIVDHYEGRIWVESRSGGGSVLHFTLPKATAVAPGRGKLVTIEMAALKPRILLVEDNLGDVELLQRALAIAGVACELSVISDGRRPARVQHRGEYASSALPDLMILDLNLPKVSGHQILAAARATDEFEAVPIVVLTSSLVVAGTSTTERVAYLRHIRQAGRPGRVHANWI